MKASRPQILQILYSKQYSYYNYYIQIVIIGNNYDDSKAELQDIESSTHQVHERLGCLVHFWNFM